MPIPYTITRRADGRYDITHAETQQVLDNANGYGYTTRQKAEKAAWYTYRGGKAKKDAAKREAITFWTRYVEFGKAVRDYYEWNFKEIARGETNPEVDLPQLAQEMGVEGFAFAYVDYLR
jgi:hypothetical protein